MAQDILDEHGEDMSTQNYEDLIGHYRAAYELYPSVSTYKSTFASALNDFGLKLMNENENYEKAVEIFGEARELYPDNQTYLDNYNQAYTLWTTEED